MIRLLQILLLVALAWIVWRLIRRAVTRPAAPGRAEDPARFEPTARCARCGTYVPSKQLDAHGACARCAGRP